MAAKKELSLADLEKIMTDRQTKLEALLQKRDQLEQTIEEIDADIQSFLETGSVRRRGQKRPRNEAPLRPVIVEILSKTKKGMSLHALAEKVKETGYKSQSRNFKNVVYQCIYHTEGVVRDDVTGFFKLEE